MLRELAKPGKTGNGGYPRCVKAGMITKIKRGTSGLRDAALSVHAQHILDNMTGNTNFPTPTPTLAVLTTAWQDFDTALAAAKNRDRQKVIIKNECRKGLEGLLNQLFDYVNLTGGTDIEMLTSSGFPLAKERTPVGDMPKPENFRALEGKGSGEIKMRVNKVHGADSYVYQYIVSPSPETDNWVTINDPASRIMVTGLVPGTQYKFRVAAVGAKGQGPWCDVITRFVS
jgi:hypothetical protein